MERNKKKLYTEIKKKTNRFIPDMILFTYFDVFDFFFVLTRKKKNGEDEIQVFSAFVSNTFVYLFT
jgi:hypothetical protein